jgi:hypothetical protein
MCKPLWRVFAQSARPGQLRSAAWLAAIALGCAISLTTAAAANESTTKNARSSADVNYIVQQSAQVTEADRKANREFDYSETDLESDGSHKTYAVHMLYGSPYQELVAIDGKPLSPEKQRQENRKMQEEIARRQHESPSDRAGRVAEFEREQKRDRRFMEEFIRAFNFKLTGEAQVDGRKVYVVQATLRPGYRATDRDSEVLTGMRGWLYIDRKTYQWVRAEAEVVHPVSIAGFVATVEPGTRFVLEKTPVTDSVWLAKHFSMVEKAKIFSVISHHKHEDVTYFDYHPATDRAPDSHQHD